jgi:hypothetical protein
MTIPAHCDASAFVFHPNGAVKKRFGCCCRRRRHRLPPLPPLRASCVVHDAVACDGACGGSKAAAE